MLRDVTVEQRERVLFLAEVELTPGAHVALSEADVRHLHVLRIGIGERVGLRDGAGTSAAGLLVRLGKKQAVVALEEVSDVVPPTPVHLLVPVADRDRMLLLAEKAAELNITSWRPVLWQRSRSVAPRGDGPTYRAKIRSRMVAAMLQSRSAWLPEIFPEAIPERAIAAVPVGTRLVLNADGEPAASVRYAAPISIAIGPEGGFEHSELDQLQAAGFRVVSLGQSILRFETAAIVAAGLARSMLDLAVSLEN